MSSTFDMVNEPILPQLSAPLPSSTSELMDTSIQQNTNNYNKKLITPSTEKDNVVTGGYHFTIKPDEESNLPDKFDLSRLDDEPQPTLKKRRLRKKENAPEVISGEIVRGDVESNSTLDTYVGTAAMLQQTMAQIDSVSSQIKAELDNVLSSRTLKSKYNIAVGLSGNLSDLVQAKIAAIKELNNCIRNSNELDYKKQKDIREASNAVNDDKAILDMYQAFVNNPMAQQSTDPSMTVLGPSPISSSVNGTGIIRATSTSTQNQDLGYVNYMANLTPEQNLMLLENNQDVKQCLIFDASTGNKWFQWMNVKTNQVVPGLTPHDNMFLEDCSIDMRNKICKNINIGETYPLIVINDQVAKEY